MADEGRDSEGEDRRGLDYEAPASRLEPKSGYWAALYGAWILGVLVANILADVMKMHLTGRHADGGVTCLASLSILPAALLATLLPGRHQSPTVAAGIGLLSSPFAVVVMYSPMIVRWIGNSLAVTALP